MQTIDPSANPPPGDGGTHDTLREDGIPPLSRQQSSDLTTFLAIMEQGEQIVFHGIKTGPPVLGSFSIDHDELVLRYASMFGLNKYEQRYDLKKARSIVLGRETTTFMRTDKYTVTERELDRTLNSFSLILEGEQDATVMTLDFEIPSTIQGANARRDRLANGFSALLGLEIVHTIGTPLNEPPKHNVFYHVHSIMYGTTVSTIIYVCIILSVVVMALSSPLFELDQALASSYETEIALLHGIETVLTWIFTFEVIGKIIALESLRFYVSDPWNALDLFVVVSGWLTTLMMASSSSSSSGENIANPSDGLNFTALRAFRALRVLRTFKMLQGIREIVETFIKTLFVVSQAMVIYFYFLLLFTIFSKEIWGESLLYSCVWSNTTTTSGGLVQVTPKIYCDSTEDILTCPANSHCAQTVPTSSERGFHSFRVALTTLYGVSMRSGMGSYVRGLMAHARDSWESFAVIFFFIFLNLFVTGMVLALFVAIIRNTFASTRKEILHKKMQKLEKLELLPAESRLAAKYAAQKERTRSIISMIERIKSTLCCWDRSRTQIVPVNELTGTKSSKKCENNICAWLIQQTWFDSLVSLAILINCIFFGLRFHKQSLDHEHMLKQSEQVFAFMFLGEVVVKVIGLGGFRPYFRNSWNCFDFAIVISSLVDVLAAGFVNLSLLRILRLLRIVRLLRRNPDIVKIVTALIASLAPLGNLILFCILIFGVFAILGMQLFGGKMGAPPKNDLVNHTFAELYNPPRAVFDTFPRAMLSLFQMMTGGAQWSIYYEALKTDMAGTVAPFFLVFGVFSNFIIINFMVVIIMSNFAMKEDEMAKLRKQREMNIIMALKKKQEQRRRREHRASLRQQRRNTQRTSILGIGKSGSKVNVEPLSPTTPMSPTSPTSPLSATSVDTIATHVTNKDFEDADLKLAGLDVPVGVDGGHQVRSKNWTWVNLLVSSERQEYSLLVLSPSNRFRQICASISSQPVFEALVIAAIIGSSVFLTLESPIYANDQVMQNVLQVSDVLFMVIFTLEAAIKTIGFGFILPTNAYLQDSWSRLDFILLIVSFMGFAGFGGNAGRMLRIARILRPLRMINRNEGLKVIVDALIRAIQPVSYTMVLLIVYFYSFGVIGMEFFLGLFWSCNDGTVQHEADCVGHFVDKMDGIFKPRIWKNPPFSFDSISESFCVLFETISLKGWPEKLWYAVDTTQIGEQPQPFVSPGNSVFFVVFIYFGSFFMMKLFVGVIVGTFRKFSGTLLLTQNQLQWLEMKRVMAQMSPHLREPGHAFGRICFKIASNKNFEASIMGLTILHLLVVVGIQVGMVANSRFDLAQHWMFTLLFTGIQVVRLGSFGFPNLYVKRAYDPVALRTFSQPNISRIYETIVLGLYYIAGAGGMPTSMVVVFRALDFTQMIALVARHFPRVRQIFVILSECILAMCNVTLVFFMLLFIYAVLGMQLFAQVRPGKALGVTASFQTFPESLLTVFLIASGDNWIQIMRDCSIEAPYCSELENGDTDCGSLASARIYFFSFYFLCFGVFVNLYVATIIDAFESKSKTAAFRWSFTQAQFERFQTLWKEFDPRATGRISIKLFRQFFFDLGVPFSSNEAIWTQREKRYQYNQARFEIFPFILTNASCALPKHRVALPKHGEPSVGFFEVLQVIVMVNVDVSSLSPEERVLRVRQQTAISQHLAAMTIQAFYRGALYRRLFRSLIKASKTAAQQGRNFMQMQPELIQEYVTKAYVEMYGCEPGNNATLLFALGARDEISFENVQQLENRIEAETAHFQNETGVCAVIEKTTTEAMLLHGKKST